MNTEDKIEDNARSIELLARYVAGESAAADAIYAKYIERLIALARVRLSPRVASRTDPEDVVLSAWRSFFLGAREGRFSLTRSGELWSLLVAITMHKLHRSVRHHSAKKRAVVSELPNQAVDLATLIDRYGPTPEQAVTLADELESLMAEFDDFTRRVLELRLQDATLTEIAADTRRSERTVRRTIASLRDALARRIERQSHE